MLSVLRYTLVTACTLLVCDPLPNSHIQNDPGSQLLAENSQANLFTTFVKARISCSSGTGTPGDIPFHFNEIQDTFFVPSGSGSMGEPEHLYAVFTSAR